MPRPLALRLQGLVALSFLLVLTLISGRSLAAEPLRPADVPEPLKPWTQWVLDGKEEALCPTLQDHGDDQRCVWPSRLELRIDEKGGTFTQTWHVDARSLVPLPGDAQRWPVDVQADGKRAVVSSESGAPRIELLPGDHRVTGRFAWDSPPESLKVPVETGLVSLTLRGAPVAFPNRDAQGTLWLQKAATNEEGDSLEVIAHRKVTDDIPLVLTTHVELHISGKSREELLGKALPPGYVPLSLTGEIPARLEPDGRVRVQVRPGVFHLEIAARSEGPVSAITRPAADGPWREGDEVWVFEARSDYRVATVEGVTSIDPQQTTLPDAWKRLPAYAMKVGDTMKLVESRRGDADPPPNQLTLERTLWLDFDGKGITAHDTLTGELNRDSRLTMAAPTVLGRVAVGGKDQFITRLGGATGSGVEIRQSVLQVNADSRIPGDPSDLPAVSWAHDFHQVSGTLHLPPGWRLLHASGVDDVPGTWVRHWSLLELFLVLITALAVGRLYGPRWGAIALVTLALTFPEADAPKWSWLILLAVEALFRVLPAGRVKTFFSGARGAAAIVVALVAVPFLVQHVRGGLYPSLEHGESGIEGGLSDLEAPADIPLAAPMAAAPSAPQAPPAAEQAIGATSGPVAPAGGDLEPRASGRQQLAGKVAGPKSDINRGISNAGGGGTRSYAQSTSEVFDPAAVVQTGPGLPHWNWQTLALRWSGPVTAAQRLHLFLLSPFQNLVLALLRAALLVILLLRLFPWTGRLLPPGLRASIAPLIILALLGAPSPAHAAPPVAAPDDALLQELQRRLLRKPECLPTCATSGRMTLDARAGVLRVRVEVDAAAGTAVPLPGSLAQWSPRDVLLDGQSAKGLARLSDGTLWIELAAGPHQIALEGALPAGASMQLALPLKPHRVEATAQGWSVAGIHEDGLADDNLQLTRSEPQKEGGGELQQGELPPFVRVERTLHVGLNWQVETQVVRVTPVGSAVVLEVPLLPGESVTTADVRVASGKALVNLGPQATSVTWHSTLEQKTPVKLVAPRALPWVEVWRIDVGPVWHATFSGIPFVRTQAAPGAPRIPVWRPWPGEEASVELVRPEGVGGQTLTIDQSRTEITPGLRATDVTLSLSLRSSRGTQHMLTLPAGAELESLDLDGTKQPVRQDGRKVTLSVLPGAQHWTLTWREPAGISPFFQAAAIDLGAPSVNADVKINVPGSRWLLFVGGPRLGPAVLFWSLLLIVLVVAFALGHNEWTPLHTAQWALLGVGLSQIDILAAAVVVGWLLALGWRGRGAYDLPLPRWIFNLMQLALVAWTLTSLGLLFAAVERGLLGDPSMQVRGNGSTSDMLLWTLDRSDGLLPQPWMLSVPLLVYRVAMLAWALWLAVALLGWLRWGWSAFASGGLWKKRPPRPVMPPPVYPPTAFPPPAPPAPPPVEPTGGVG
ncbi:MAG TPA: hypothetical protein VGI39_10450 [Polyangiaceae bacterium]|jgi:hypothetical protein